MYKNPLSSSKTSRPVLKLQTGCISDFIIFIDMSQRMKTSQYIYFVIQDSYFEQDFTFFLVYVQAQFTIKYL